MRLLFTKKVKSLLLLSAVCNAILPSSNGADIPEEFCCPISGDIMLEPVSTPRGHSYERDEILKWIDQSGTSPMSRDSLTNKDITPNINLKAAIAKHPDALKIRGLSREIEKALEDNQATIDHARDKDIVVLIGIAGAGKSTLGNILASKCLDINIRKLSFSGGFKTGDQNSVTKYPEYLESPLGLIFDLPGFNDTDGAAQDIINAALIGRLFKAARSIKVVNVVDESLFGSAGRTENLAKWHKSIKFLPDNVVKESTVVLVARSTTLDDYNDDQEYLGDKVAPRTITHVGDSSEVQKAKKTLEHLLEKKGILRSPESKKEDASAFLARKDWLKKLLTHIQNLDSLSMPTGWKINMDLTPSTASVLSYIFQHATKRIYITEKNSWPKTNDSLFSHDEYLKKLILAIEGNKSIASLKDFAQASFDAAKKEIIKEFEKDFESHKESLKKMANKKYNDNVDSVANTLALVAAFIPGGAAAKPAVVVTGRVAVAAAVKLCSYFAKAKEE